MGNASGALRIRIKMDIPTFPPLQVSYATLADDGTVITVPTDGPVTVPVLQPGLRDAFRSLLGRHQLRIRSEIRLYSSPTTWKRLKRSR